jgi:hypothetical protein
LGTLSRRDVVDDAGFDLAAHQSFQECLQAFDREILK